MLNLGCHLSVSGGHAAMVRDALAIGANTFAFFTRNPRSRAPIQNDPEDLSRAAALLKQEKFAPLVAHGAYAMNLCGKDPQAREAAAQTVAEDLQKMANLPGNYYNFHPGCHVGQGMDAGIEQIAKALRTAMEPGYPVTVLLETMAGKGSEVGSKFEELKWIIDAVGRDDLGVCLDTCHVYDAGYDIVGDLEGVIREFDRIVGLNRLKALHLNDSKNPFASHKDRHACLGEGSIGLDTFRAIVNHPALKDKSMILETPNDLAGYGREIALLRTMET